MIAQVCIYILRLTRHLPQVELTLQAVPTHENSTQKEISVEAIETEALQRFRERHAEVEAKSSQGLTWSSSAFIRRACSRQ